MTTIAIDTGLCCGDSLCVKVCPAGCFRMKDGKATTLPLAGKVCIQCGQCVSICPKAAITLNGEAPLEAPGRIAGPEELAGLIQTRRSVRAYKDTPVPRDVLEKALETARYAPTGKNSQDVEWLGVDGKEKLRELAGMIIDVMRPDKDLARLADVFDQGLDPIFRGAPCVLFAHSTAPGYNLAPVDGGIAGGYMELVLHSMGLASCWAGYALGVVGKVKAIRDFMGLPEDRNVVAALMVGYPRFRYARIPRRKPVRLSWMEKA